MEAVEKKEKGVSKTPIGRSIHITGNGNPNGVLAEEGNSEKPKNPPKKQKRGVDGEIVEAFLLSPEKDLPKLRPRKSVPSFRKVELNESDFERVVGKRVKVYWSGSRKWFPGCIKSFDNGSKLHKILYEDGDKEELNLKAECFELEVLSNESFNICFESGSHHKKEERSFDGGEVKEGRENFGLHGEPSKDQVTSENVKLANCMDGGEVTEALLSSKREFPHSKLRPRKLVPSFQKVELNENDFERIIGKRVKVYWPGSRKWFVGCIKSFDNDSKLHRILYDDDDKEDLDLKSERFELEVMSTESNHNKKGRSSYGGELKKEMIENGLLNAGGGGPISKLRPWKSVPSFQKVELSETDYKRIVGMKVKVYWSGSRRWFTGCIKSFDSKKKLHKILYDDGEREDLNLKGERFELEVMSGKPFNLCFNLKPNPKVNVMTSDGVKPPKKRKSGTDEEITGALLSSSKDIPNFKLRPRKSIPSFQKVELSESDFQRIVGKRVKVYWSGSRRWFAGCIKSFDSKKKLHKILYDDGESEDLNLNGERFELEVMSGEHFNLCFKLRPNPEKNALTSDGGMVNVELKKNGSLDVANVGQVKKNAPMIGKPISKATRQGRFQLHQGKGTEKTQDMDRDVEIDVPSDNNDDQVYFVCTKKQQECIELGV